MIEQLSNFVKTFSMNGNNNIIKEENENITAPIFKPGTKLVLGKK